MNENSQPIWIEFMFASLESGRTEEELSSNVQIKSGVVSHDGE